MKTITVATLFNLLASAASALTVFTGYYYLRDKGGDACLHYAELVSVLAFAAALDGGTGTCFAALHICRGNRRGSDQGLVVPTMAAFGGTLLWVLPLVVVYWMLAAEAPQALPVMCIGTWLIVSFNAVGGIARAGKWATQYYAVKTVNAVLGMAFVVMYRHNRSISALGVFSATIIGQCVGMPVLWAIGDFRRGLRGVGGRFSRKIGHVVSLLRRAAPIGVFQAAFALAWAADPFIGRWFTDAGRAASTPLLQRLLQPAMIFGSVVAANAIPDWTKHRRHVRPRKPPPIWHVALGIVGYVVIVALLANRVLWPLVGLKFRVSAVLTLCLAGWALADVTLSFAMAKSAARRRFRGFWMTGVWLACAYLPVKVCALLLLGFPGLYAGTAILLCGASVCLILFEVRRLRDLRVEADCLKEEVISTGALR